MQENPFLSQLQQFYEEDPQDPFNLYALALAYLKSDPGKAADCFDRLLEDHPGYLPTYYQAGTVFSEMEAYEKALEIFRKGMALATAQGNHKALDELKRAERALSDDLEEW